MRKLTEEGVAALSAGKLPQARQKFEQAYIAWPSLDGLYQLGRIAEAQGRSIQAADLYRRYLAAAGRDVEEQVKVTLRQYIARITDPASEVDVVSGDAGALLLLDGEVAGVLPLSGPLLVSAGEHRFTIEKAGQKFQTSPQPLQSGQRAQLQVTLDSRYAVLTLTPALILLIDPTVMDESALAQLFAGVAEAAQKERSFLLDRDQTSSALVKLKVTAGRRVACARDVLCQEELAREVDAAGVLTIKAQAAESGIKKVSVQLLDVSTGALIGEGSEICGSCSASEAKEAVTAATRKLLQDSASRGRGTLQVDAAVLGAKVRVDGRMLGAVPLSREAFEGQHEVVVEQDEYTAFRTVVQVTRGQTAAVLAVLQRAPKSVRTLAGRPLWRFVAGGATIGAGLLLTGFGASALDVLGECIDDRLVCKNIYATGPSGGALVGIGAALVVSGTVLIAWPGK